MAIANEWFETRGKELERDFIGLISRTLAMGSAKGLKPKNIDIEEVLNAFRGEPSHLSDKEKERIVKQYKHGRTIAQLAMQYGVKWHTIQRTIKRAEANQMKSINQLCQEAHQNALNKGWYQPPVRSFGEIIALIHSEVSEALEDHRNGYSPTEIYYEGEKPCGIPVEFADVIIRICDSCAYYGIDLEAAIAEKMDYNATRPQKHGGKII